MRPILLLLLLAACDPTAAETAATCDSELQGEASLALGQLVDGVFVPLEPGSTLAVHSGGQGGYHSDLVVKLSGEHAERSASLALAIAADVGEWIEEQSSDLVPRCERHGEAGWYHQGRLFWDGPGCGEDPCIDEDDESAPCWEYRACVENEQEGWATFARSWLIEFDATIELVSSAADFEASTRVEGIDLVEGETEQGDGR